MRLPAQCKHSRQIICCNLCSALATSSHLSSEPTRSPALHLHPCGKQQHVAHSRDDQLQAQNASRARIARKRCLSTGVDFERPAELATAMLLNLHRIH